MIGLKRKLFVLMTCASCLALIYCGNNDTFSFGQGFGSMDVSVDGGPFESVSFTNVAISHNSTLGTTTVTMIRTNISDLGTNEVTEVKLEIPPTAQLNEDIALTKDSKFTEKTVNIAGNTISTEFRTTAVTDLTVNLSSFTFNSTSAVGIFSGEFDEGTSHTRVVQNGFFSFQQ